jgi:tRNA (guanine10-N2)-dimethyltransferase
MLPPKLAIMMINLLGLGKDSTILDPFCGSGTIVSEAALLGFKNIYGSDISERAVEDSIKNINWIKEKYPFKAGSAKIDIQKSEVAQVSKVFKGPIHGIVAEPYLGIPRKGKETETFLEDQAVELKELYLEAFNEFKNILDPKGKVVFVVPRFYLRENSWVSISDILIPELSKIGITSDSILPKSISKDPFVLYRRKGQLVGREIWRFKIQ